MTDNGSNLVMPVSPMGGYGNMGGFGGWGSDIWVILLVLFAFGGWGNGFGGGFGGGFNNALGYDFPWLLNGQNGINANTNSAIDQLATTSALGDLSTAITSGFGNVQNSLCNGFAGVNATVNGAQSAIAQQLYSNQIADMQTAFAGQTAMNQGFNGLTSQLAQCCCDNRLATCQTQNIVQNEGNTTRFADANNTRDIIDSQTRGTQAILDKLCQLELDGVKAQVDAKNDRIVDLQNQLNMASFRESQVAQNAFIAQGLNQEVDALYNRLNSCPVPTTPVYGRTPIFQCNQNNGCGCGCGSF